MVLPKKTKMGLPTKAKEVGVQKKTKSARFGIVIASSAIQSSKLELPNYVAKDLCKDMLSFAYLRVPNEKDWPIEIVNGEGKLLLHRGWTHFVERHSITSGYKLTFRFVGNSRFRVAIYDTSFREINYSHNHSRLKAPKPEKVEENIEGAKNKSPNTSTEEQFGISYAENRVLQRANSFQSENPHFIAHIKKRHLNCNSGPVLPKGHCRTHFNAKDKHAILRVNGKNWPISFLFSKTERHRISFATGWKDFMLNNELKERDICVFELVHVATKTYDVHIFRIEEGRRAEDVRCANAIEKANAFVGASPGFTITVSRSYANTYQFVRVPVAHGREYLKDEGGDNNVIVVGGKDGETWELEYRMYESGPVLLSGTWVKFRSENRLKVGSVCGFKVINVTRKMYEVVIF